MFKLTTVNFPFVGDVSASERQGISFPALCPYRAAPPSQCQALPRLGTLSDNVMIWNSRSFACLASMSPNLASSLLRTSFLQATTQHSPDLHSICQARHSFSGCCPGLTGCFAERVSSGRLLRLVPGQYDARSFPDLNNLANFAPDLQ